MRFSTFLLAIALGGISGPCAAQAYLIDLSSQPLAVPNRTFYIKQVLDGRTNRAGIGTVLRGMANIQQPAELKPTVTVGLQTLLTERLPARPTDQPLLAVVRALHVEEHVSFSSEQASDDVALDFYLLDEAGSAHFALGTSETVQSKGMETTGRHPRQLAQALQTCLSQLGSVDWAAVAAQPGRPVAELLTAQRVASVAYPVLTDTLRAGFYRTFLDFRNNSPVANPGLLVETVPNTGKGWEGTYLYTPYLRQPDGGRGEQLRGAWGFSDGRQLYIYHRKSYRLLVRRGEGFSFVGASAADPGAVSTAGLLGGALGGAIAAAATSGRATDYSLSLLTGRVLGLADAYDVVTADTVLLHIYCRKSNAGAKPLPVYLNKVLVGQIAENQLLTLPYTDHINDIHLRLGDDASREVVFQPDFKAPVYVKVARNPYDDTKPPLEIVSAKVGTFDLRALKASAPAE